MSDLRGLAAELGLEAPKTLLQTGNLVFGGAGRSDSELETLLETELIDRFGLHTDVFVRSREQWMDVLAGNPFQQEAINSPSRLVVMVLGGEPSQAAVDTLRASISGPELVQTVGRQLYVSYPAGIGRSKVTTASIESHLGLRGTGRNWNTALKLAGMAGDR